MTFTLFIALLSFLSLLIHYQKQDKIYIGYTTVLCLLFGSILTLGLLWNLMCEGGETTFLTLLVWVLGAVLIYVMHQLTLAFEKIGQLSRHIASREVNRDLLNPQPDSRQAEINKSDPMDT